METREEVLENLKVSLDVFKKLDELMERKETIENRKAEIEAEKKRIEWIADIKQLKETITLLLLFIMVVSGACFSGSGWITVLIYVCIFIIGIIVFIQFVKWLHKTEAQRRAKKAEKYSVENMREVYVQENELEIDMREFANTEEWQFTREYIPEKYAGSRAVNCFYDFVASRRADNLKEAINLYEDLLFKEYQMLMQKEQLAATKEQSEKINVIAENTERLNATYGYINAHLDHISYKADKMYEELERYVNK